MSEDLAGSGMGSDSEGSDDGVLAQALESYLAGAERGRPVDPDRLAAEYPSIADELRSCLEILRLAGRVEGDPGAELPVVGSEDRASLSMLGDFHIIRQVGRGGMGVVYEAEQVSLRRRVALKVLPFAAAIDPHQLRRFQTEAQAAAQLHHTNIVPVFSVGCERGVHYYAMQYIEGQTLAALIQDLHRRSGSEPTAGEAMGAGGSPDEATPPEPPARSHHGDGAGGGPGRQTGPCPGRGDAGSLPHAPLAMHPDSTTSRPYFRAAAHLGVQAAEALEHAHSLAIVHRDIKPANLLVDVRGHLWITDFGLARIQADTALTMTGDVIGTLRYMSPEQAMSRRAVVDHRTDIYSLGATLYEMLALRPAFEGRDRQELLRQIAEEEPRPLRRVDPIVPADLETIVLKAMAKEPIDRYATARELADDLRRFLELKPILARRPTPWDRALKLARRHTAVVAAALLALLLTVGGLATGLVLIGRERDRVAAKEKEALASAREAQGRAIDLNRQLYINRVNRAFGEWRENNVALAAALLEDCPVALRGWEWSYCSRLCHLDSMTLRRDRRPVRCLAFSPDGHWLFTAAKEHSRDDAGPGEWTVWDAETGQERQTRPTQGTWAIAVAPSGRLLAVGSSGGPDVPGTVALWELSPMPAAEPARALRTGLAIPRGLTFSPDGRTLAAASSEPGSLLEFWEVATGRRLGGGPIDQARISALAYDPDGRRVALACTDGIVRLREAPTGAEAGELRGHLATVYDVAYSPDGRRIVSGSLDETVRVWDAGSLAPIHVLRGHGSFVRAVAFDPGGTRIASASEDNAVRIWDAATGKEIAILRGHAAFVTDVAFRPDGRRIASAGEDGAVKLWDTAAVEPARTMPHPTWVSHVAFSPDGATLATMGQDGVIRTWDAATGRPLRELAPRGEPVLAFSRDGMRIASTQGGMIRTWDAATGRPLRTLGRHPSRTIGLAYSPDGRRIASAGWDGAVRIWDAATGASDRLFRGPWGIAFAAAYSPDGARLAAAFTDGFIRIFDTDDGREVRRLGCEAIEVVAQLSADSMAFSPDGRWLIACSNTADRSPGEVRVFELATGRRIFTLRGHTSNVMAVAFSPDARRIATASFDRTVKLWVTETGQEIFTLRGHTSGVLAVAFSADGRRLATGSIDSTARIWDTAASAGDRP